MKHIQTKASIESYFIIELKYIFFESQLYKK
jgi:hypothetical protein